MAYRNIHIGGGYNRTASSVGTFGHCCPHQRFPAWLGEGLAFTFTDLALYGKATQDWLALFKKMYSNPAALGVGTDYSKPPAAPAPALATSAYVGTYTNNFYGEIQIIEQGDGLAIVEGPSKLTFPLKHYDRDLFTCDNGSEKVT